jgi:DNA-directed RNA polymerase subunit alpha
LELTIESGTGYVLASEQSKQKLGVIPLDASFSPVTRVSYAIEATRVGRRTDFDRLVLKIHTDGTITPSQAVNKAAKILMDHFQQIIEPVNLDSQTSTAFLDLSSGLANLTVEELELPTRVANSLRHGGYKTLGDLAGASAANIAKVKNIGVKSVEEIISQLKQKGINIKE